MPHESRLGHRRSFGTLFNLSCGYDCTPASHADADAIAAIYNQGIEDRIATFETRLCDPAEIRNWFSNSYPVVVVEVDRNVVAFAAASSYRPRACYAGIAEVSVYVERGFRGRGAGRRALEELIRAAEGTGFWKLLSRVFTDNLASRALLRSLGFREVGIYEKHGCLEGVWRDVVIVERLIPANLR